VATLIRPARGPELVAPANGVAFTAPELQALVGGYIEVVATRLRTPDDGPLLMIVNDDGKRERLPVNRFATALADGLRPDDVIVGPAVICTYAELGEPEPDAA